MNKNCSKTHKCSNFRTRIVVKPRNVVIFSTRSVSTICWYTSVWKITIFLVKKFTTLWVEKITTFLGFTTILVQKLHISGFNYDSGSKVTTFLVLLHFWLFTAFLGLSTYTLTLASTCTKLQSTGWDSEYMYCWRHVQTTLPQNTQSYQKSKQFNIYIA